MHSGWNQVFLHVGDLKKQWLEEKRFASLFFFHPPNVIAAEVMENLKVVLKQFREIAVELGADMLSN